MMICERTNSEGELFEILRAVLEFSNSKEVPVSINSETVSKIKGTLPKLLDRCINPMNVAQINVSETREALKLINRLSVTYPQVFFYGTDTSSLCRIFFYLLPILTDPLLQPLFLLALTTFTSLLSLLYSHDLPLFRSFIQQSIGLLADLIDVAQYHDAQWKKFETASSLPSTSTPSTTNPATPPILIRCYSSFLSRFSASIILPTALQSKWFHLDVSTPARCISLQCNVTRLIAGLIDRMYLITSDLCIDMWPIIIQQLQQGPPLSLWSSFPLRLLPWVSTLDLHETSLQVLAVLLSHPESSFRVPLLDSILETLLALLTRSVSKNSTASLSYLNSSTCDIPPVHVASFKNLVRSSKKVEEQLSKCFNLFFKQPAALSSIRALSQSLLTLMPDILQGHACDELKVALISSLTITIQSSPSLAKHVTTLLPFISHTPLHSALVKCFICSLDTLVQLSQSQITISALADEPANKKRRRLTFIQTLEDETPSMFNSLDDQTLSVISSLSEAIEKSTVPQATSLDISDSLHGLSTVILCLKIATEFGKDRCSFFEAALSKLTFWLTVIHSLSIATVSPSPTPDEHLFRGVTVVLEFLPSFLPFIIVEANSPQQQAFLDAACKIVELPFLAGSRLFPPSTPVDPAFPAPAVASTHLEQGLLHIAKKTVEVMGFFPPGLRTDERKRAFMQALQDSRQDVVCHAVACLPLFLSRIGFPHVHEFRQLLDSMSVATTVSVRVREMIGRFGGYLVCLSDVANSSVWMAGGDPIAVSPFDRVIGVPFVPIARFETHESSSPYDFTNVRIPLCDVCDKASKPRSRCANGIDEWKFLVDLTSKSRPPTVRAKSLGNALVKVMLHNAPLSPPEQDVFCKEILPFLKDSEPSIRLAMCGLVPSYCVSLGDASHVEHLFKELRQYIVEELPHPNDAHPQNPDAAAVPSPASLSPPSSGGFNNVHYTMLGMLGELAKGVQGEPLLCILVTFIDTLAHANLILRGLAYDQIRHIALRSGISVAELVSRFGDKLYIELMKRLVSSPPVVEEFCASLMQCKVGELAKVALPRALPSLFKEQRTAVLVEMAKKLDIAVYDLCINNSAEILAHIFMFSTDEELPAECIYLMNLTTVNRMERLVDACISDLLSRIVLLMGDKSLTQRAVLALKRVHVILLNANPAAPAPTSSKGKAKQADGDGDTFAGFIKSQFLQFMDMLAGVMLDRNKDMATKENALRSLDNLLGLLEPQHLNSLRPKVMATLRTALRHPDLQQLGASVYFTFVQRLEISNVAPILSSLVVDLLAYLAGPARDTVVKIFNYLIIDHRRDLRDNFKSISFLPSEPVLSGVTAVIAEEIGTVPLREQLNTLLQGLAHESMDVRCMVLANLRSLLAKNRAYITNGILGDTIDPTIESLVKCLLVGCRESNNTNKAKIKYSECLGELGAIDPGRLNIDIRPEKWLEKGIAEMAHELISDYLVRALSSLHNYSQDRAAYAIQEILKLCGCSRSTEHDEVSTMEIDASGNAATSMSRKGKEFWNSLRDDIKEIAHVYLDSKYTIKSGSGLSNSASSGSSTVVYRHNITYRKWISIWVGDLIGTAKGARSPYFIACRGVVKDDLRTANFLLPYLILNVLQEGADDERQALLDELLSVLRDTGNSVSPSKSNVGEGSEASQMATQKVFEIIDWLHAWLESQKRLKRSSKTRSGGQPSQRSTQDQRLSTQTQEAIQALLGKIPQVLVANASYRCKAYARALMHLEAFLRDEMKTKKKEEVLEEHGAFLQKVYSGVDEPDGLAGLAAMRSTTSLDERILDCEHHGLWAEALTCYDQALQIDPANVSYRLGLLRSLRNLGHWDSMLTLVQGNLPRLGNDAAAQRHLYSYGVQAAWRLGNWDTLASYLGNEECEPDFEVSVGKLLLTLRSHNEKEFQKELSQSRLDLMASLSAASMESYQRAYPVLVKLHALQELERCFESAPSATVATPSSSVSIKVASYTSENHGSVDWEPRLKITQPSFKVRETILNLRRVILDMFDLKSDLTRSCLQIAKTARTSQQFQTANNALLKAGVLQSPQYHLERAKLLWVSGTTHEALMELQEELKKREAQADASASMNDRFITAKMHLMIGRWMSLTGHTFLLEIKDHLDKATKLVPNWEKGAFYLGKYYDALLAKMVEQPFGERNHLQYLTNLYEVISSYGRALAVGHNYIYHALPRLLTVWFDYGTAYHSTAFAKIVTDNNNIAIKSSAKQISSQALERKNQQILDKMKHLASTLPAYQWYSAFPQLISRICHRNEEVFAVIESIIVRILLEFPHQSMWVMAAMLKSQVKLRKDRADQIFKKAKQTNNEMIRTLSKESLELCELLLKLCVWTSDKNSSKIQQFPLKGEFGPLFKGPKRNLIVPLQSSLTIPLPATGKTDLKYRPYAEISLPTIDCFNTDVQIMPSLQKPKKIQMEGSDGNRYYFLCKPKDDLRKDSRVMEFNTMINKLLKKDPDSRKRQLHIRTYAVVPLDEESGLIEWVNNTTGLKYILEKLYGFNSTSDRSGEKAKYEKLRKAYQPKDSNGKDVHLSSDVYKVAYRNLLDFCPPIFHEWFLSTFPEPSSWLEARIAYSRTTAVISMIGYVLGLGDRHGENILFDSSTGECVHVDFNCLFWKGRQFSFPERVPFRLTPNLVDAMGLTGVEGVFRKSCEITLSVLRANRETLLSVLETLIYDPFVDWTKTQHGKPSDKQTCEVENAEAVITIETINKILRGEELPGITLSVEGQVHQQIQEALSFDNLSSMYSGWSSWY